MAVAIIYETHQTSTDDEDRIATGWLPGELSTLGRAQAVELGERRRHDGIAVVFTSDLHRAVETAEIAFAATDIPIVQDVHLRECDYGELIGAPVARIAAERANRVTTPFPGGQRYEDVVRAMDSFLRDLATDWDGRQVLIIAHSANLWALQVLLGGATLDELVVAPIDWQPGWFFAFDPRESWATGLGSAYGEMNSALCGCLSIAAAGSCRAAYRAQLTRFFACGLRMTSKRSVQTEQHHGKLATTPCNGYVQDWDSSGSPSVASPACLRLPGRCRPRSRCRSRRAGWLR